MAGKHICILVHLVWSTARRQPQIAPDWQDRMYGYLGGVFRGKGASLLCAGGMRDHVHLYTALPSTVALADLVNAVKSNSSRWIHETFPGHKAFAWQKGYGAFSISKSGEERLLNYIRNQQEHHRVRDFKAEFLELLDRHHIEYDERYLWE